MICQEEKLQKVLTASGNNVESYWPGLFAKALQGQNIGDLLTNIGSGAPAAAGPAAAGEAAATGETKEDKKKEDEDAGDVDMGGLFGDDY